jgi:hypothetical protein
VLKKVIVYSLAIFITIVVVLFVAWRIAIKFDRNRKVQIGNAIVLRMAKYRKSHLLPRDNNWRLLDSLGFDTETSRPEYDRLSNDEYEIVFVDGFDGPYLLWNSKEKVWKESEPTIYKKNGI